MTRLRRAISPARGYDLHPSIGGVRQKKRAETGQFPTALRDRPVHELPPHAQPRGISPRRRPTGSGKKSVSVAVLIPAENARLADWGDWTRAALHSGRERVGSDAQMRTAR